MKAWQPARPVAAEGVSGPHSPRAFVLPVEAQVQIASIPKRPVRFVEAPAGIVNIVIEQITILGKALRVHSSLRLAAAGHPASDVGGRQRRKRGITPGSSKEAEHLEHLA